MGNIISKIEQQFFRLVNVNGKRKVEETTTTTPTAHHHHQWRKEPPNHMLLMMLTDDESDSDLGPIIESSEYSSAELGSSNKILVDDPSSSNTFSDESGSGSIYCVEDQQASVGHDDGDDDKADVPQDTPPMPTLRAYFMEEYVAKPVIPVLEVEEDVQQQQQQPMMNQDDSLATSNNDNDDGQEESDWDCETSCGDDDSGEPSDDPSSSSSQMNADDEDDADERRGGLMWCKFCDRLWSELDDFKTHVERVHHVDPSKINIINKHNYATYDLEIGQTCCPLGCLIHGNLDIID